MSDMGFINSFSQEKKEKEAVLGQKVIK